MQQVEGLDHLSELDEEQLVLIIEALEKAAAFSTGIEQKKHLITAGIVRSIKQRREEKFITLTFGRARTAM